MHQSKHAHMIVRIVDNFLLVTTDKETFRRFLSKMYQGIPDLGVKINKAKTKASCSMKLINSDEVVPSIFAVGEKKNDDASCCFFPWCGFLFVTSSCEVRVDYSRSSSTQAIDSLAVDRTGNKGINLQVRMKAWIRPRFLSLLYESTINGDRGSARRIGPR